GGGGRRQHGRMDAAPRQPRQRHQLRAHVGGCAGPVPAFLRLLRHRGQYCPRGSDGAGCYGCHLRAGRPEGVGSMTPTDTLREMLDVLASRATDNLLDLLDVIERGPRSEYGVLVSADDRRVRLWLIEEIERRHPDAVDYLERRFAELPDDDPTPYNVLLREAVVAVGGIG